MRIEELGTFILERLNILIMKNLGCAKPWTNDRILQQYRFCNVRREDDRETIWIRDHWRNPNGDHPDVWFAMMVARFFNWSPTLAELKPLPFDAQKMLATVQARAAAGAKVFTGAYTISTNGISMAKAPYVVGTVLQPAWDARKEIRPRSGDTLANFDRRLQSLCGVSGFMSGQIIADTKYVGVLRGADDWHGWAVSGPGSRRGMQRVTSFTGSAEGSISESYWKSSMDVLREALNSYLAHHASDAMKRMLPLHAQDVQNCLCEFDKYERVRLGEGKPRATYRGAR